MHLGDTSPCVLGMNDLGTPVHAPLPVSTRNEQGALYVNTCIDTFCVNTSFQMSLNANDLYEGLAMVLGTG